MSVYISHEAVDISDKMLKQGLIEQQPLPCRDADDVTFSVQPKLGNYSREFMLLYISHFLSAFGDRTWEFAVPLFLMNIWSDSWQHGAVFQLVIYCSLVILLPFAGTFMDNHERLTVIRNITFAQNLSTIVVCCFLIGLLLLKESNIDGDFAVRLEWSCFAAMLIFAVMAELTSQMSTIALERDWIVVLAQRDEELLARVNPVIRRLDLISKLISPLIFAAIQEIIKNRRDQVLYGCIYIISYSTVTVIPQYFCVKITHKNNEDLRRPRVCLGSFKTDQLKEKGNDDKNIVWTTLLELWMDWKRYFTHEIFWASFSFALLFFTVLDNSFLMTSYLTWTKFDLRLLALSRGLCALMGIVGTALYEPARKYFRGSHEKTGILSIWFFFFLILPIPCAFFLEWHVTSVLVIFVVLSRGGLWMFDLGNVLLLQTHVKESDRGKINACQMSMFQFLYVVLYTITSFLKKPSIFDDLTYASVMSVFISAVIFSLWAINRLQKRNDYVEIDDAPPRISSTHNDYGDISESAPLLN